MKRRSFFLRNFLTHSALILVMLLAVVFTFFYQTDQYARRDKQNQLKGTAVYLASQTAVVMEGADEDAMLMYSANLERIVEEKTVSVLITDPYGQILLWADEDGLATGGKSSRVNAYAARHVRQRGYYAGQGTLDVLDEECYVVGAQSRGKNGDAMALVFVASPNGALAEMMSKLLSSFAVLVLVMLAAALLLSYYISMRMTRPLKTMANAAREFASGNFAVRVPEDNRCDEIDELAIAFNNMANDLAQLEELTRGFIGNVSHEFKTPMTTIGGFVDGMIDGTIPVEQRDKYLKTISEEVKRLSRMVNRMLDAAKIQSGELIINSCPFDFSEMTAQILFSFEQKIDRRKIDMDVTVDDRIMVMGDRDTVYRAVYNLVDNAVKFTPPEGRLTLIVKREATMCDFSITNTGTGIAPEDIPHVFDRFYKADRSRSLDKTGAGLGLYIVKNIINLHGGDISVRSDGGETEFSFTLPLAPNESRKNT